jgi:hypothetical protein
MNHNCQHPLIVKHDADKRAVDVHAAAVVVNETQFPETDS